MSALSQIPKHSVTGSEPGDRLTRRAAGGKTIGDGLEKTSPSPSSRAGSETEGSTQSMKRQRQTGTAILFCFFFLAAGLANAVAWEKATFETAPTCLPKSKGATTGKPPGYFGSPFFRTQYISTEGKQEIRVHNFALFCRENGSLKYWNGDVLAKTKRCF